MSFVSRYVLFPRRRVSVERLRTAVAGRTVLVTGASYGIGEATARMLGDAGAEVLLVARSADKLAQVAGDIRRRGGRADAYPFDLYRSADVPAFLEGVLADHPRVDVVVSNAGKSIRRATVQSAERDDLARSMALNFTTPSRIVETLLPRLLAQGGGQVVNVSSVSVRQPSAPRWGTYQGTKAGFDVWLRSVANEVRPDGVAISSVYFPLVRTRMIAPVKAYAHLPALSPAEAAQVIAYAIVTRRDRVAPWWLWWSELGTLLLRGPIDRVLTRADRPVRR